MSKADITDEYRIVWNEVSYQGATWGELNGRIALAPVAAPVTSSIAGVDESQAAEVEKMSKVTDTSTSPKSGNDSASGLLDAVGLPYIVRVY